MYFVTSKLKAYAEKTENPPTILLIVTHSYIFLHTIC